MFKSTSLTVALGMLRFNYLKTMTWKKKTFWS